MAIDVDVKISSIGACMMVKGVVSFFSPALDIGLFSHTEMELIFDEIEYQLSNNFFILCGRNDYFFIQRYCFIRINY